MIRNNVPIGTANLSLKTSPAEAIAVKRRNMKGEWPTSQLLLDVDKDEPTLKKYDEIKNHLSD